MLISLGIGFETQVLLFLLPRLRMLSLPGLPNEAIATGVLLISAVVAPWMGRFASRQGDLPCVFWGVVVLTLLLGLALLLPVALVPVVMLGLGVVFSLVMTSLMALALQTFSPRLAGLGSGLYLGSHGAAAAGAIALVTDAGMPGISDPGYELVRDVAAAGYLVGSTVSVAVASASSVTPPTAVGGPELPLKP